VMRCVLIPSVVFGFVMCGVAGVAVTTNMDSKRMDHKRFIEQFAAALVPSWMEPLLKSKTFVVEKDDPRNVEGDPNEKTLFENAVATLQKKVGILTSLCVYAKQAIASKGTTEFTNDIKHVETLAENYINSMDLDVEQLKLLIKLELLEASDGIEVKDFAQLQIKPDCTAAVHELKLGSYSTPSLLSLYPIQQASIKATEDENKATEDKSPTFKPGTRTSKGGSLFAQMQRRQKTIANTKS